MVGSTRVAKRQPRGQVELWRPPSRRKVEPLRVRLVGQAGAGGGRVEGCTRHTSHARRTRWGIQSSSARFFKLWNAHKLIKLIQQHNKNKKKQMTMNSGQTSLDHMEVSLQVLLLLRLVLLGKKTIALKFEKLIAMETMIVFLQLVLKQQHMGTQWASRSRENIYF